MIKNNLLLIDLQKFEIYDSKDNLVSILAPNNLDDCTITTFTQFKLIEVGNFYLIALSVNVKFPYKITLNVCERLL